MSLSNALSYLTVLPIPFKKHIPLNRSVHYFPLVGAGMGSILTMTSFPQRTSPVLRGKWVLSEVLGVDEVRATIGRDTIRVAGGERL